VEIADLRLLHALKQRQGEPVLLWNLISEVVNHDRPKSRAERDRLRLWTWSRVKRLLHLGALQRVHRRWIRLATVDDLVQARVGSTAPMGLGRRVSRKFRHRISSQNPTRPSNPAPPIPERMAESNDVPHTPGQVAPLSAPNPLVVAASLPVPTIRAASPLELTHAAQSLAAHRWQLARRVTGSIGGRRVRLGQTVRLPTGEDGRVLFAWRGRVLVETGDVADFDACKLRPARADALRLVKNPHAVSLGSRKAGRTEIRSARKAAACRRNGCRPVRPGRRPRGRPRKQPPGILTGQQSAR